MRVAAAPSMTSRATMRRPWTRTEDAEIDRIEPSLLCLRRTNAEMAPSAPPDLDSSGEIGTGRPKLPAVRATNPKRRGPRAREYYSPQMWTDSPAGDS